MTTGSTAAVTESLTSASTAVGTETETVPSQEPQRPDHTALACRAAATIQWKTIRVSDPSTHMDLQLEIPSDWALSAAGEDTYTVSRAGAPIGYMTTADLPKSYELLDSALADGDLNKSYQVHWYREGETDTVRRTLRFVNMQWEEVSYRLFFNIAYTELDDAATEKLVTSVSKIPNTAFIPPADTNGSDKILILGNSFVSNSFSGIGLFLQDMLIEGSTGYTATVISKGGQGLQAFATDDALLTRLEEGEFCYVFQCGFYSDDAARQLDVIQNACDISDTKLVIFPAHNEQQTPITKARLMHDSLYFLDWRSEIQSFIDGGLDRSLLCYDDYHQHSTSLAGYIGAHMIYRSLFGTVPPSLTPQAPLPMSYVRSTLGDAYVDTLPPKAVYSGGEYTIA